MRAPVIIMAQDEGRFGRITDSIRKCWAPPKGSRPKASPMEFARNIPLRICGGMHGSGQDELFDPSLRQYCHDEPVLGGSIPRFQGILCYHAGRWSGWHRSHGLELPKHRLIQQPSHSPELNPVEHLWEDLRENHLPNKAFKSLEGVEQALCKGLRDLHSNPSKVRSMMNFPYLKVTC